LDGPIDVAVSGGYVYFTEWWRGKLSKVSTNGGQVTDLLTGLNEPFGIVVARHDLYVAEGGRGGIMKLTIES
jgi:hypothetical protein